MSKCLKIFFVVFILLMIILSNFVQATSIDMNLTNTSSNNVSNDVNQNISNTSNNSTENTNTNLPITSNQQTTFESNTTTSLSNLPEANLGLSNILSIILIVIGVLLIFLAIAILIRLKH